MRWLSLGPFVLEKLENMWCLLSSPNTHNLDRYYVHYIVNTCWLVLHISVVPHDLCRALLPILESTLHEYMLPLLRKTCSQCLHVHGDFSSMCELSPFHMWLPLASFNWWAGSLYWLPASCYLLSKASALHLCSGAHRHSPSASLTPLASVNLQSLLH